MKSWKIPVTWEVCATINVEADTLHEAMEIARDDAGEIPLPTDTDYVNGSWALSETDEDFVRSCYNDEQSDESSNETE